MRHIQLFLLLLFFFFSSCNTQTVNEELSDYPNSHLLLEATYLNTILDDPNLMIIDTRSSNPEQIIPGAVHFSATQQLVDPEHEIAGYLVGPESFVRLMQNLGLNNSDRVLLYDDGNALSASRLFYALDYYGFTNASILNGGLQSWLDHGLPVSDSPSERPQGSFTATAQETKMCSFDYITEASNNPDKVIFDVRSAEEYTGETERATRNGHIPNAVNLEWSEVLEAEGIPYFLPADEIESKYESIGITRDKEIIPHCQSNVRGSHTYFTLLLMGFDSVRPYEASWAEYGNRDDAVIIAP